MTNLMAKALAEVSQLSTQEQDALTVWILEELASERRWQQTFADSEDLLSRLAEEALVEHREGRTQALHLTGDGQ